ncbi:hypothetical protein BGZ76_008813 [Entomortierella beljakovae]|nr:hypothetical protein BGZ76_008813 [Entomortierella beljakovae]
MKIEDDSHAPEVKDDVSTELGAIKRIAPAKKRKLFYIFIVNEEIGYLNFISFLLACFGTILLVVYLSIVQPFVLNIMLHITGNVGNITGSLALYDEIIALPATLIWGVLSDRVGRRIVYSIGFLCLGVALILYPFVKNVYPHMLLCRLLFSLGSSACTCMMTGTLGDIAGNQHERGRVSAMAGMFTGFGALVSGMVLVELPWQLGKKVNDDVEGLKMSITIIGACAVAFAFIFFFTMPKTGAGASDGITTWFNQKVLRRTTISPNAEPMISPWHMLKYGILAGRDPRVALAYVSSFVARADTVLFSSFISLWVIQYYVGLGWCRPGVTCFPAAGGTHELTGMGQGISLAFAPLFGYASEKFEKPTVLAVAGLIGAVGSIPFAFTKTAPSDKSNYAFVTLTGIGQIGMIVAGMTLVNGLHVDPKYRGSVAGVFSFCGAVSIMVMARLGGYLFDVWMHGAPFVLMGIAHLIIALFSIYVRIITPRLVKEDIARLEAEKEKEKGHKVVEEEPVYSNPTFT